MAEEGEDAGTRGGASTPPPTNSPPATSTPAQPHPAAALDAAGRHKFIRDLLDQANAVVTSVTNGMARHDVEEEELEHDTREIATLVDDILTFPVNLLATSARTNTNKEAARAVAALNTASQMAHARCQAIAAAAAAAAQTPGGTQGAVTGVVPAPSGTASSTAGPAPSGSASSSSTSRRRSRRSRSAGTGQPSPIVTTAGNTRTVPAPNTTQARLVAMAGAPTTHVSNSNSGFTGPVWATAPPITTAATQAAVAALSGGPRPPTPNTFASAAPRASGWAIPSLPGAGFFPPPPLVSSSAPGATAWPMPHPPAPTAGGVAPSAAPPGPSVPPPPRPTPHTLASAPVATGGNAAVPVGTTAPTLFSQPPPNLTVPSWVGGASVPFAPTTTNLGADYYLSFPYPWNGVPQQRETPASDIIKLSTNKLPKFNGDRRVYIAWRNTFIPAVHLTLLDTSYKMMLLRSSLETPTRRMKEFVDSLVGTPEGYRQAIITLEERYGGSAALLMTRQEAILALPDLRAGEFSVLEMLHTRLNTYLLEWEGIMGAPMTERETITFYTTLMGKIDPTYARQYMMWVDTTNRRENLPALQMWLAEELKRHRQVNIYERSRSGSLGRGGGAARPPPEQAGFRRPLPFPPSGQPERPAGRSRAFYEGEEYEEELLEEEGPEHACVGQQRSVRGDPAACTLCQGDHGLGKCSKFREMTPQERKAFLIQERRCFLCFQRGHGVTRCQFKFSCMHCGKRHHTLIHGAEKTVAGQTLLTLEEESEDWEGAVESLSFGMVTAPAPGPNFVQRVSLRTAPVLVVNPVTGKSVLTNAMLDDGCTASALVSRELASKLELTGRSKWTQTEGVGGHVTRYQTLLTCIRVLNPLTKQGRAMPAQVMERPAGTYQPVNWNDYKAAFSHLAPLEFPTPVPDAGVELMLGNQAAVLTASLEEIIGGEDEPVARRTALGWTAVGPVLPGMGTDQVQAQLSFFVNKLSPSLFVTTAEEDALLRISGTGPPSRAFPSHSDDRLLTKLLERMLQVEDPGEAEVLSPKEQYIVKQAQKTLTRVGKQYQVGCTWAPGGGRPPLNLAQAKSRLLMLEEGKHFKKAGVASAYAEVIRQWRQEGFVRQAQLGTEQVLHLLPHFPILKSSETTPVRPVMDCSVSLNRHLLAGPSLINEVPAVLLRFRSGLYSFSGDVRQMFLKILLPPEDRPYHCFLWRDDAGAIEALQFQVHVFGNTGSPFLVIFVVREHARAFAKQHPDAVDTLFHSTLIDDVLDSTDREEDAAKTLLDVRHILAEAGMKIAKCHSNSPKVLAALTREEIATGLLDFAAVGFSPGEEVKLSTLGLQYSSSEDSFLFSMDPVPPTDWTKRGILRIFPRLFDPLGLLLPYTVVARMLFSSAARMKIGWDSPLPAQLQREWTEWTQQFPQLTSCAFPRCLKEAVPTRAELHVFADASSAVFAATAYLKAYYADRPSTVRLVAARAHVVPEGRHSIPRLELLAADLAVSLRRQVQQALKIRIDATFHWSDSTAVLFWLNNEKDRMQLFVYNRVARIRRGSDLSEWRWTPTDSNPADLPTRGMKLSHLQHSSLWHSGPTFLNKSSHHWPSPPRLIPTPDILKEMKKEEQVMLTLPSFPEEIIDWRRFSSWIKLRRMLAIIFSARDRVRARLGMTPLDPPWKRAERALLRQTQLSFTPASNKSPPRDFWKSQGFVRLTPFLDESGVWRGRGRISLAESLPRDSREPILLPRNHPAAALIVQHLHRDVLSHAGGVSYLLARFHMRYWMPAARQFAFSLLSNCVLCRRRKARPSRPPPGQLPQFRLPEPGRDAHPFAVAAVDCAGPFKVKRGRSYENYYLLLITCCSLRAVRLELLSDLTVDAFLLALTRATSRGVNPHTILSDNGGNFVSANRLLSQLWQALPQQELQRRAPQIQWRFNPPYASHYGGVFERLIRAAKEALYHVLPSHLSLSLEQLHTSFTVVEAILNARPLAYVSTDPLDPTPITPNHFLYGSASVPLHFPEAHTSLARRWSSLQQWTSAFRAMFAKQARPHLQLATKTRSGGRDLQEGDVVTFYLPSAPNGWLLAQISKTFPGPDGRVRTVQLRLPHERNLAGEAHMLKRDVGSVALLLPAEQHIHPSHI